MSTPKETPGIIESTPASNGEITPFALAAISSQLVQAGLVPRGDARQSITCALEFIETGRDVMDVRRRAAEWKAEQQTLAVAARKLTDGKAQGDMLPIADVIQAAGLSRLTLSLDELKSLGIKKAWQGMTEIERTNAIYGLFASKPIQYESETPLASSGRIVAGMRCTKLTKPATAAKEGLPAYLAEMTIEALKVASRQRVNSKSKLAAQLSANTRRKPRAPKGDDGKFQIKKRNDAGTYRRQPD